MTDELKTLKDLELSDRLQKLMFGTFVKDKSIILTEELRQEVIKHGKKAMKMREGQPKEALSFWYETGKINFIKEFFDIGEEELI